MKCVDGGVRDALVHTPPQPATQALRGRKQLAQVRPYRELPYH